MSRDDSVEKLTNDSSKKDEARMRPELVQLLPVPGDPWGVPLLFRFTKILKKGKLF